ncbi:MAG: multidrug efflux pump subunit AcrB [Planctomycetota bacterium]|jgi:multidrug efflux pump subunit AcrB
MTSKPHSKWLGGAVRRPVMLFVIMAALMVISTIAYIRIPVEMMPKGMQDNGLRVIVVNPGASAHENETKVSRVIEEQIRTLSGIRDVWSSSREDRATVRVYYERDIDMDVAKAELRDRLERARTQLPDTVERVVVWSWDNDQMPLMWLAVLHSNDSDRADYLVDTIVKRKLEAIDGISQAEFFGMLDDSIRILLDEEKVKAANLDIGELIQRLSSDNFASPLGEVEDGGQRVLVRSNMRFNSIEEIEAYPIGNGQTIADIGQVLKVKTVRDRLSRIDGQYSYFGQIGKESTANIVETARRAQAALDELEADPRIGGDLKFMVLFSQGDLIEASLSQLQSTALWGGALAALVLFVFLRRVRVTLCVALSIPVSAMLSLAWVYFTGGTFNILTMTGITLGIGMLVDNSVVVIENISRLHGNKRTPIAAAVEGVSEVGLAVSLATMTTVVVFLPLIFMSGNPIIRIMFGALGLPLCVSLLFSLMVALVFLPAVAARIVGPRHPAIERIASWVAPIGSLPIRVANKLGQVTLWLLRVALKGLLHIERFLLAILTPLRWPLALGILGFAAWKVSQGGLSTRSLEGFLTEGIAPNATRQAVEGIVYFWIFGAVVAASLLAFGTPIWRRKLAANNQPLQAQAKSQRAPADSFIEVAIRSNAWLLRWSLDHRLLAVGASILAAMSVTVPLNNMTVAAFGEDESRSELEMRIELEDNFTLREASREMERYEDIFNAHQAELGFDHLSCRFDNDSGNMSLYWDEALSEDEMDSRRKRVKDLCPALPGHELRLYGEQEVDTRSRTSIAFQLLGPDEATLSRLGEEALELLKTVPGLNGLESPLQDAPPQVRVALDAEKAWQLGVTADIALQNIAWALRGFSLPRFHEPGREIPFIIEYDEEELAGLNTLRDLSIFSSSGPIALASVADLEFGRGPRTIWRHNGQVSHTIIGHVDSPNQQLAVSEAGYAKLREMELPRGFHFGDDLSVRNRQNQELEEMRNALFFSVVLVFLLMAILFESLIKPFAVLFTIPFAMVGAYWTLYLTDTALDSVGYIGLIILVGVVVNNGIVLIDRTDRLFMAGMSRREAVLQGGASRVRPILMTALTTIFGLLPMVLAEPPSNGIDYRALGTCVAGGLAFSTFFTLWVVPLSYTIVLDVAAAAKAYAKSGVSTVVRKEPKGALE